MDMNRTRYSEVDAAVAAEVRVEIARRTEVTIAGIAARLGMRRATLSARVNGHAPFSPTLLAAVAGLLGTTASEIMARAEHAVYAEGAVA